jgi:hypothetical protein
MHCGGKALSRSCGGSRTPGSDAVGVATGGLEEARQKPQRLIHSNPGTTEAAAASLAKSKLDAFAANPPSGVVVEGNVQPYLDQLAVPVATGQDQSEAEPSKGALDRAEGAAAAGNGDLSSKLVQRATAILNSPKPTLLRTECTLVQSYPVVV